MERMTHPTTRERTRATRVLQRIQGTIHRRIHQIRTPRLRRARIHASTGQVLRQSITQKTQAQRLSARLRRRTTRRKTTIRQLMRSVRINHQKTQPMLSNIHRNRLNRKITEINHQRLLRIRTQRRRLIQATRMCASHLILSRNTHLSQTRTQRITISRGGIRFGALITHRTRELQQRQRRRTLQSSRRRQTATDRNTRINQQVSTKLIGQHNIPATLLVHRPRNTRHIGEPALQMPRLNIANHNRALIAGHL